MLKGESRRALIRVLLIFSTMGFLLLFTLLILSSSLLYLGAGYVELYSTGVLMIVLLFPLSLGLTLSSKGMISFPIMILLAATFVGALFSSFQWWQFRSHTLNTAWALIQSGSQLATISSVLGLTST